jgi:hypothetical protein
MNPIWPHDIVRVEGPDASTYLHSQLSQDLRPLAVGGETWSFVLQPTGRIDALVHVHRVSDERFDLGVDLGGGEALVARLNRFRIRVKAEVALVESIAGNAAAYHAERVAVAWPAIGAEITETSIPAEFPEVVKQAVSFTKGCYPGQELVERMDSRAAEAPRHLVQLTVPAGTVPGDPVVVDGDTVGTVTSVSGTTALALVKRGVAVGSAS